jgi:hypothetical protein
MGDRDVKLLFPLPTWLVVYDHCRLMPNVRRRKWKTFSAHPSFMEKEKMVKQLKLKNLIFEATFVGVRGLGVINHVVIEARTGLQKANKFTNINLSTYGPICVVGGTMTAQQTKKGVRYTCCRRLRA